MSAGTLDLCLGVRPCTVIHDTPTFSARLASSIVLLLFVSTDFNNTNFLL